MPHFEFMNKVLLRGVVGANTVQDIQGKQHARFAVVTEYAYMSPDSGAVVDTFWITVSAFEGKDIPADEILKIGKGTKVEVIGRLRATRYADTEGNPRIHVEALASKIHVLTDEKDESILPDIK